MFSYEDIQKYGETDMCIYKYIAANLEKIQYMTIRELARETHTSPSSVLRFCGKNGLDGYAEMKRALQNARAALAARPPLEDVQSLSAFFARANSSAFEEKLDFAVKTLRQAGLVIFFGIGSSGTLARYGARHFSNFGKLSMSLEDSHYPIERYACENTVAFALSESGETAETVEMARQFRRRRCRVLSITNAAGSTLEKLSDWNFSCRFQSRRLSGGYNATTQAPVLFVIEALANRL
ncbi:MAG: MurR/RpiR family transcriptional regulator [Clostridiales bacterium]|nr:MurR/RpiR family transcriptional regulator [Clostridiales bacterium]